MKQAHEDLQARIAALRTRFADIGARAAAASHALTATSPPPERLLQDLTAVGAEFTALRAVVLEQAASLALPPAASSLTRLRDLESVITAVIAAEEERERRAAWDVARENAVGVLDRVVGLIHRDDKDFAALAECQAKARELRAAVSGPPPADIEQQTTMLEAILGPFVALITLADGWDRLDDERCASLEDVIARSFGRPLGLAALRGKVRHASEVVTAPEPPPTVPAAPDPEAPSSDVSTAVAASEPIIAVPVDAPPPGVTPAPVAPPAVETPRHPSPVLPPSLEEPWATTPPPDAPDEVEIRLSSDEVHVETPAERRAREALLERLATKTAQWWIRARTAYKALAARDVSPASAAREFLGKFPYLLSVPLQKSAEFAGGRLAEGYAILLQRIEKEERDFVETALTRLNPQFTTGGRTDTYPLGQELYLYVVAQGRLYKTYPEFLKDILGHVLPEPGVWIQGAITEEDEATQVVTNGATPGSAADDTRRLTTARERAAEQTFSVTTGPLTTRVFTVRADTLKQPVDVDIKLKENDSASDRAWIIQMPVSGKPDTRRHRVGGATVESLGKEHHAVVIAVFNSDPSTDKRYELSITLKRKPPALGTTDPVRPSATRQSPFAPKR